MKEIICTTVLIIVFMAGCKFGSFYIKTKAIDNGVAYYSCDPTNGISVFNWRKP